MSRADAKEVAACRQGVFCEHGACKDGASGGDAGGLGRVLGCVGDETYEDEGRHNGAGECRRNLRVRQGWGRWEGRRTGGRRAGCKQAKAASGAQDDVLQAY
jgi:hypothetical protein